MLWWWVFFFNDTATTEIYTLSLHDALPIYAPEEQVPAGAHGPPHDLRQVDPDVVAVLVRGRLAGVGVHRQSMVLAGGPHPVVHAVVVRRVVGPPGGDHHAADARVLRHPLDLLHRPFRVVPDGDEGDAGPAVRLVGAQLDEEPVVGPRAGEGQLGIGDGSGRQPRAE